LSQPDYNPNSLKGDQEVRAIGPVRAEVDPDDMEEALKARLPLITNPRMASYLSYRACGFSIRESCNLVPVNLGTVLRWRREDETFASYETKGPLGFLQTEMSGAVNRAEFHRCMRLFLRFDFKIIYKANYAGPENLTQFEREYLKAIRKEYGPGNLLALEKAILPDEGVSVGGDVNITVNIGDEAVESDSANRAAARELLAQFSARDKYLESLSEPETLEGKAEVRE